MTPGLRAKYQFPWRPGNHFELLVDGDAFFPRMLEAIELARSHVWLEIYLFESGRVAERFIAALARAAHRGVEVRVLADDYGALKLARRDRDLLLDAGASLVFYNPLRYRKWLRNLFRDHRKLLIVDGEVVFVSGTGITDDFANPHLPERSWRETAVRASGPVLTDWQELFRRVWNTHAPAPIVPPVSMVVPHADGVPGRVAASSALRIQDLRRSFLSRVLAAEHQVWVSTAYFVPSRRLLRALKRAAARGVDVRLLLPGPHTDHPAVRHAGRRFYAGLLRHGVRLYEYQPRFLHAKGVLCDQWTSIGSSNFDRWNLRWNLEANQEVDDPLFADQVRGMFENDFRDSVEIDYARWRKRGLRQRVREQWWGRVDMFLESIGRRRVQPDRET
jgi:phosphatidylserine/phosphatidylglycerophosphate/cardiolipin synthase-like enzyme